MTRFLSTSQVTEMLGISAATLYSYVSRGLIRSEEAGDDHRARRYHAEDVERLLRRKEGRRDPAKSAREALHWGEPVLESAITLIADGRLYYRGQDAAALAKTQTFEQVAALLWADEMDSQERIRSALHNALTPQPPRPRIAQGDSNGDSFQRDGGEGESRETIDHADTSGSPSPPMRSRRERHSASPQHRVGEGLGVRADWGEGNVTALAAMQVALALTGEEDLFAFDLQPARVRETGARIVRLLTSVCTRGVGQGGTTAEQLALKWRTPHARLLDAALILCADHELNASSFAARVIASTGATPYAVVAGALAALSGHKHGGHTRRVAVLLDELSHYGDFLSVIRSRLARGDGIPGFGHPLYPDGDPRAAALLAMVREAVPNAADYQRVTDAVIRHETGKLPNIDYALVVLERALGLPQDAAFMLFAIGRSAGWIAHAIEQYARPELLRPRAKYVGALP